MGHQNIFYMGSEPTAIFIAREVPILIEMGWVCSDPMAYEEDRWRESILKRLWIPPEGGQALFTLTGAVNLRNHREFVKLFAIDPAQAWAEAHTLTNGTVIQRATRSFKVGDVLPKRHIIHGYRHSERPNLKYNRENDLVSAGWALRDIVPGDEITISHFQYN